MRVKFLVLCLASLMLLVSAQANNVQISGVSQSGNNISFTISWDNSWNTTNNINPLYPNNWDAVWIFIKYQNQIDNIWKQARLSSTAADHSVSGGGAPLLIETTTDSMGIFIRRSSPGAGSITNATVTLRMGPLVGTGDFNFKVFGIEMVRVPQDTVQVGDGNVSGVLYLNPITIDASRQASGLAAGLLYSGSPAFPATFPMGYNAFYAMKYEASNEQWVDFLNTLTYDQQASRVDAAPNGAIGTNAYTPSVTQEGLIEIVVPGLNNTRPAVFGCDFTDDNTFNTPNDGQNLPFLAGSKGDMLAYLDWAGLRPMTELEYEKASRGPRPRVQGEYAWGSTALAVRNRSVITASGTATESSTAAVVNGQAMASSGIASQGPARSGIFATASSGRESSGASFYGIMELTGNLWELVVPAVTATTTFTGTIHGNGSLNPVGQCDVAQWPAFDAATGIGIKGGSWWETSNHTLFLRTSYRLNTAIGTTRTYIYGIRGVRSAN